MQQRQHPSRLTTREADARVRTDFRSAAALAALIALAACQASPAGSPEPSAGSGTPTPTLDQAMPSVSSDPTATASVSVEPVATSTAVWAPPTEGPDRPTADSFAVVVTDDLRVRTKPRVSEDSIKLKPLLWDGALVFVIDGPVTASGYDWYLVRPMGEADLQVHPDPPDLGWVAAASKGGEPWLRAQSYPCVRANPFEMLSEFDYPPHGLIGLACFGASSLRFDAELVSGLVECDPPSTLDPAWLDPCQRGLALADPTRVEGDPRRLHVAFDPAVDVNALPEASSGVDAAVTVTGQFDHRAARTCQLEPEPATGFRVVPPELVVLGCRAQFVVTSISQR
jgi:hypothetical protein